MLCSPRIPVFHAAWLNFVSSLFSIPQTNNLQQSIKALTTLKDRLASTSTPILAKQDDAQALAKDVSGEGLLALKADNFSRWGRHYLPSLARAHRCQQSGNFMDPDSELQVYGRNSVLFLAERDKLDAAFDALPPPKPSIAVYHKQGGYGGAKNPKGGFGGLFGSSSALKMSSMKAYNSSAGPCFSGECLVKVPGAGAVRIEQLKRGMEIESMVGPRTVAGVVRTAVPSGETLLCRIGDLKVTPWHPVAMKEEGCFL